MLHNPIPFVVLAAVLSACNVQPELLNSELIQQRFGNYGVAVLQQESGVRRSSLYSTENGVRVCRTYAVVEFVDPVFSDLASTHEAVLDGQSIGTTFRDAGWDIRKETMHIGDLQVPDSQHAIAQLMHLDAATTLSLHVYRLMLEIDTQSVHYATVIESHHPLYLTEAELRELYSVIVSSQLGLDEVDAIVSLVLD